MSNYRDNFELNMKDIEIIENALRSEIRNQTKHVEGGRHHDQKIKALNEVLGKIHNQKIWYGQVHRTGVPLG